MVAVWRKVEEVARSLARHALGLIQSDHGERYYLKEERLCGGGWHEATED